jgi:predicted Zn-dependent peptidase
VFFNLDQRRQMQLPNSSSSISYASKALVSGPLGRNRCFHAPKRTRHSQCSTTCHASGHADSNNNGSPSSAPKTADNPASPVVSTTRRSALQLTTAGALHALASRSIFSADAAFAAATATGATSPTTLAKQLEARVQEFTLSNGMRFIVSERKTVPVVSFHTYADVGAYDEAEGVTGVAHLLEHLAFKGTPRIGTTDFKKEAPLLDAMDDVFYELIETNDTRTKIKLNADLDLLLEEAGKISIPNAYGAMLSREGAVGLNAATTHDSTKYYCSLPANKLELWFALEAERFEAPVFREVYSEKKVVFEERRMRIDNAALGPFQEEFAQRSLTNNYKRPVIGYEKDLLRLGRKEVASFFAQHYGPQSLTVAIVGDVKVGKVRQLAEKYFGGWKSIATPGGFCGVGEEESLPIPPLVLNKLSNNLDSSPSTSTSSSTTSLPIGTGSTNRELLAKSIAGPAVLRAFYRPCIRDTLSTSNLDLVNDTLTGSRSARLYRNLVEQGKALTVSSYASFPAEKHPGQFIMYGIPAPGVSPEKLDLLMQAEVASLAERGPTETEVRRYIKAARMGILETLQSNSAFASTLASYQVLLGNWQEITSDLERVESLTGKGAAATARKYLRGDNSFVGYIEKM